MARISALSPIRCQFWKKLKGPIGLILIGGRYRAKTQNLVSPSLPIIFWEIKVSKAFIGANGIDGRNVTTNEEEGNGDAIIITMPSANTL